MLGEYGAENVAVRDAALGRELAEVVAAAQPATRGRHAVDCATKATRPTGIPRRAQLTHWEEWGEPALAQYDGMVWYRAHVQAHAPRRRSRRRRSSLGTIDDVDLVWINGRAIGSGFGEGDARLRGARAKC